MARGQTSFDWGDGEYTFALPLGQLEELQEKINSGPFSLLNRLQDGSWRQNDVRETIRLGLIGGGTKPGKALTLTRRYVDEQSLLDNVPVATVIVLSCLVTPEGEPSPGGDEAGVVATESPSPTFTP